MPSKNPRAWVEDTWYKRDKTPSARHGRGRRWRVRVFTPMGKTATESYERKTDAEQRRDELNAQFVTGTWADPKAGRVAVGVVLDKLMETKDVKGKTLRDYESLLKTHIRPRWGDTPVKAVQKSDVQLWVATMRKGGLSASRTRKSLLLLNEALELAVDDRLINVNPAARVKGPKQGEKREGRPLTLDQILSTTQAFKRPSDRALFLTLVLTGLRWGEASALQVGSVDLDLNKLTIWRTYSDSGQGGKVIEEITKNKERRWAPLSETLKRELLPLMKDKGPAADLFTAPQGGVVLEGNWLHRVFRPALRQAGIAEPKDYRIHDLRHTFASLNAKNGISPKELQRVLGHKTLAITTDTYMHLYEDDFGGLRESLDKAMRPLAQAPKESEPAT
ncbi:tyrosine-type recombinase/integrase [Nesterenkonia ebinurensis]|uniref:tyrosine-type recombinase/integrase n=1 Tax=Nesterenkonia ebinurensis TaxID=2608252 RepID=UPI00123CA712|nr:site-specific integrase [Nesterenkonia ebinurensis]